VCTSHVLGLRALLCLLPPLPMSLMESLQHTLLMVRGLMWALVWVSDLTLDVVLPAWPGHVCSYNAPQCYGRCRVAPFLPVSGFKPQRVRR
jgi:hypothetical protein